VTVSRALARRTASACADCLGGPGWRAVRRRPPGAGERPTGAALDRRWGLPDEELIDGLTAPGRRRDRLRQERERVDVGRLRADARAAGLATVCQHREGYHPRPRKPSPHVRAISSPSVDARRRPPRHHRSASSSAPGRRREVRAGRTGPRGFAQPGDTPRDAGRRGQARRPRVARSRPTSTRSRSAGAGPAADPARSGRRSAPHPAGPAPHPTPRRSGLARARWSASRRPARSSGDSPRKAEPSAAQRARDSHVLPSAGTETETVTSDLPPARAHDRVGGPGRARESGPRRSCGPRARSAGPGGTRARAGRGRVGRLASREVGDGARDPHDPLHPAGAEVVALVGVGEGVLGLPGETGVRPGRPPRPSARLQLAPSRRAFAAESRAPRRRGRGSPRRSRPTSGPGRPAAGASTSTAGRRDRAADRSAAAGVVRGRTPSTRSAGRRARSRTDTGWSPPPA